MRVAFSPPTPNWPAVTVTVRNEKCYKHKPTRPGTPLDTADAMVNSPGHVGVFLQKSGLVCAKPTYVDFRGRFDHPKASSHVVQRTARPRLSIVTDGRTTKLSGVGVRLGSIKRDGVRAGALGLAHDRELRHFEARKGARKTVYSPRRLVFSSSSRVSSRPQFLAAVPASETCRAPAITT